MKLGPAAKPDKRNKKKSSQFDSDVMSIIPPFPNTPQNEHLKSWLRLGLMPSFYHIKWFLHDGNQNIYVENQQL